MGVAWIYARAHRVLAVGACTLVLVALLWASRDQSVGLGSAPVRLRWLVMLAVGVLATAPLSPAFGEQEHTAVRPVAAAGARCACALAMSTTGFAGAVLTGDRHDVLLVWFTLVTVVGVGTAAVLPDQAWLVVLVVGGGSVLADHLALNLPVSRVVEPVGLPRSLGLLVLATGLYLAAPALRPFVRRR